MRRKSKRKELRLKRKGNTYLWEELINGLWEPDGEIETAGGMSPAVFFFFRDFYLFHPDDLPHCPYGRSRHIV